MPLDTSIALGVRPPQIDSPINQMAKLYELRQAQQANVLNELKLQETQRGASENEAIRNYFASQDPSSPEFARGLYSISPTQGAAFEKSRAELAKEQAQTGKVTAETEATKFETTRKRLDIMGQAFGHVRNNPTPEAAAMALNYLVSNGVIDQAQADQQLAVIAQNPTPENIKALADQGFTAVLSAKEQLPTFQMQSLGGKTRVLSINPVTGKAEVAPGSEGVMTATPGEVLSAQTQRRGQDITLRGQDLTNARELLKIENEKGKNSPEAIAMRAKMTELGKAQAKFEAAAPEAIQTGKLAVAKIDELLASPGLKPAVGAGGLGTLGIPGVARFIPGTDAADFKARLDEVLGGAFMEAFNTLKGGGQITEKEGEKATAAITRMSTSQSEKEFIKAAKEFQEVIKAGVERSEKRMGAISATDVDSNNPLLK